MTDIVHIPLSDLLPWDARQRLQLHVPPTGIAHE